MVVNGFRQSGRASHTKSMQRVACGLERTSPERRGPSRHPEKESWY